jgi:homoserine kinase
LASRFASRSNFRSPEAKGEAPHRQSPAQVAVNALLGSPLDNYELLSAALVAEERVAGRHLDNLAPALLGGIILIRSLDPLVLVRLPVPPTLRVVLVHPKMQLRTADARAVLPTDIDRATAMAQAAAVATMVAAFCSGDLSLLRGAVDDRIAEPARAQLLPGFLDAKAAAMEAGSLGCSIAGGGPSAFALADGEQSAEAVLSAMLEAYRAAAWLPPDASHRSMNAAHESSTVSSTTAREPRRELRSVSPGVRAVSRRNH